MLSAYERPAHASCFFALLGAALVVCSEGCTSASSATTTTPAVTTSQAPQTLVTPTSTITLNAGEVTSGQTQLIMGSMDATWAALKLVYGDLNIPVKTLVAAQHLIGNPNYRTRIRVGTLAMQKIVDCGDIVGIPNADTHDIVLAISSYLTPNPKGGVNLVTRIDAISKAPGFSGESGTACVSLGGLEKLIAELVRKRVRS